MPTRQNGTWTEILSKIILHSHLASWRAVVSHTVGKGNAVYFLAYNTIIPLYYDLTHLQVSTECMFLLVPHESICNISV